LALAHALFSTGGGIAAYITTSSVANALYGATAAIKQNSPGATWAVQLFQGGAPSVTGTGGGTQLLPVSTFTGTPNASGWFNYGTEAVNGAAGGQPIWFRIVATSGEIGVDAVLGTETPGGTQPGPGPVPEPLTMGLVGSGFLGLALFRRFRK
jgi:hypothetical protein